MASRFDCKPTKVLRDGRNILFNGTNTELKDRVYKSSQVDHGKRLVLISDVRVIKEELATQRARGAYIASVGRADLTFGFASTSKVIKSDEQAAKYLNKHIMSAMDSPH